VRAGLRRQRGQPKRPPKAPNNSLPRHKTAQPELPRARCHRDSGWWDQVREKGRIALVKLERRGIFYIFQAQACI
jgi:hypothetical protein